jgi:nucleoside-diphosphate-sugar epimerase
MEGDLVLITGVTGHIGFRVLRLALEYGYPVRAVVRSQAKADAVLSNPVLKAMEKDDKLEMVIVPDLTMPHAFDEAAKDVKYVIHCASPVPFGPPTTDDAYNEFIKPAVDATLGMLDSAFQSPSVRRIVVTSSCIAVATVAAAVSDTGETYTADTRQPEMEGPFSPGTPSLVAYAAGKVAALNRAEVWMKERRPRFDAIHLMPSFVVGRNDLCTSSGDMLAGTNRFPLDVARGQSPGDGAVAAMAMVV